MDEVKSELEITRVGSPSSEGVETKTEDNPPAPEEKVEDSEFFEGELQRVMKERDNYKEGLLSAKKKLKLRETGEEVSVDEFDERVNQTAEQIVEDRFNQFRTDFVSDVIDETMGKIAKTPQEKELIKYHYSNTIKQTGFSRQAIERDLARAKMLANETKFANENKELKDLLISRQTAGLGVIGANEDRQKPTPQYQISNSDMVLYARLAEKKGIPLEEYLGQLKKEGKIN